jgi:inositol polyphosphate 5-phosphatase INPP5B/F
MLLIIFVKKDLRACVSDIKTTSVGAGIMGVMVGVPRVKHPFHYCICSTLQGNKGATAIRLTFQPFPMPAAPSPCPITLTFVNSHLAAFEEMLDKRNADFHDISRRLTFGPRAPHTPHHDRDGDLLTAFESEALFWLVCAWFFITMLPSSSRRAYPHTGG